MSVFITGIGGKIKSVSTDVSPYSVDSSGAVYIFKKFQSAFHIIHTCFQSVQRKQ